ncbi:MAG: caspase family protein [Gammaproteobacteria bacterium]|nr:caspase family protein [Gammaproteobacteria bacterium]
MADHAVVIGIDTYPGFSDLQGPCNDADAFRAWLIDSNGGGLDPANVMPRQPLWIREFPAPVGVADARPVLSELETLFRPLVTRAALRQHTDGRLFIFAAGHGFADSQDMNSAALFTANAELLFPLHLAVIDYANFFRRTWAFDEVILIMDACRSTNALQQISKPPLPRVNPHANAKKVKMFVGYGAGFDQVARERAVNGTVRGIFTMALLDALKNANPNRQGRVNGTTVKRHIHNSINSFAGDVSIPPPEILADEDKDVFFLARPAPGIDVEFNVDAAHHNHELVIEFGGVDEVYRANVVATPVTVMLSPGLYKARIEGTTASTKFEVPSDVDVTL